ncbi:Type I restriction modification DNA specificity domain protein (fragment) [Cupriavidus necator]|uniref:Type I restriction modification DNA specificity domain protein n=2 Tax=Cupriavidus necator TaxID=106590 RepID=A0A1K0IA15_CUPNE
MPSVPMAINQDVKAIFPAVGVSPSYLLKVLQFIQPRAEAQAVGSTVKGIRIQDYLNIPIPLAPIESQPVIAKVLETVEAAITQTEVIISKLKAVKQGLLHDLLTRGIDTNGDLRPPQDEAPHLYQASPLGWIPKDWDGGTLGVWLDGNPRNGYSPKEAPEWTGVQMLGLGCLTTDGFLPVQLKPAPYGDKRLADARLRDGDLLVSRANTRDLVGLVGIYKDVGTPCTYPDLMMRLAPSAETSAEFLQLVLQSSRTRKQIQANAVGTSASMVKISGRIVSNLVVAMPKKIEQGLILNKVTAIDTRLRTELQKANVMWEIKAGLMDDLLTGRVRVTPLLKTQQEQHEAEEVA